MTVTVWPPAVGPLSGLSDAVIGTGAYVYVAGDELPPPAVTTTSTGPLTCAGVTAVRVVSFTTVTSVAGSPPKLTVVPGVNPVPVMVTVWPP